MIEQIRRQLENQYGLPVGTSDRLKSTYDEAACVPEHEEARYATAWDAYHAKLDSDDDMAFLARVYGEHCSVPIFDRINAQGVFAF